MNWITKPSHAFSSYQCWNSSAASSTDSGRMRVLVYSRTNWRRVRPRSRAWSRMYFADPDGHPWEVVVAPGIEVGDDRRVHLPD